MTKITMVYEVWCMKGYPCPYCVGRSCKHAVLHEPPTKEIDTSDIPLNELLYWSGDFEYPENIYDSSANQP